MTSKRSGTGGQVEAVRATSGVLDRFGIWKHLGGLECDVQLTHHVAGIIETRCALKRAKQQRTMLLQFFAYSVNAIFHQLLHRGRDIGRLLPRHMLNSEADALFLVVSEITRTI